MTEPVTSKAVYIQVYLALMALLAATVAAVYVNRGFLNLPVTLAIAVTKALLVVIFFMHARYSARLIWIYAILAIVWIAQLIAGTLADILTRG